MPSLQGHFLIASSHLGDPNFTRTVVLMVRHDDEGAFGVVLTRPSEVSVREVFERVGKSDVENEEMVRIGGPCEGPLMAIHTLPDCGETQVLPGVFFSTDRDALMRIVDQTATVYRLFSGYSGWSAGQLEGELEAGGWLTLPATAENIFAEPDDMWVKITREIGRDVLLNALKIKHVPDDVSLN